MEVRGRRRRTRRVYWTSATEGPRRFVGARLQRASDLRQSRDRAATQPSLRTSGRKHCDPAPNRRAWRLSSNKRSPRSCLSISYGSTAKAATAGRYQRWTQVMSRRLRRRPPRAEGLAREGSGDDGGRSAGDVQGTPAAGVRRAAAIREAVRTLGLEDQGGAARGRIQGERRRRWSVSRFTSARGVASPKRGPAKCWVERGQGSDGAVWKVRFKDRGVSPAQGRARRDGACTGSTFKGKVRGRP